MPVRQRAPISKSRSHTKDLTKTEWKPFFNNTPGTAIFWLIDQVGDGEQLFVPDVDYTRCRLLAGALATMKYWSVESFRWVPVNVDDVATLINAQCGGPCTDDSDCINISCVCKEGTCRRK